MVNRVPDDGTRPEEHRDEGSLLASGEGCLSRASTVGPETSLPSHSKMVIVASRQTRENAPLQMKGSFS